MSLFRRMMGSQSEKTSEDIEEDSCGGVIKCPNCGTEFIVNDSAYADLLNQVRGEEFEIERQFLEKKYKNEIEAVIQKYGSIIDNNKKIYASELEKKRAEYNQFYEAKLAQTKEQLQAQIAEIKANNAELQTRLENAAAEKDIALKEERMSVEQRYQEQCAKYNQNIIKLQGEIEKQKAKYDLKIQQDKAFSEKQIRFLEEELQNAKDMKLRLSTKMIGESLEQHCEVSFNQVRAIGFPNAYFEKDNDAKTGTKGDYIFRDYEDGIEYISIMFEMKNESDVTATKRKNFDFLKKLDKDREKKKCEYAVLVSLLESDNEYYNTGIVDVSHKYPKMYVIRPQFFIQMISILRNAAKNGLEARKELAAIKTQNVDVEKFNTQLGIFKEGFARDYRLASEQFGQAIEEIDKAIAHLQKIKDSLISSENHLRLANDKAENLTIRRLTRGNTTMKEKFKEAGIDV